MILDTFCSFKQLLWIKFMIMSIFTYAHTQVVFHKYCIPENPLLQLPSMEHQ